MGTLMQEIRYAARLMRKKPGFTAAVAFILSVGIAANMLIFSVVNALIFRPLPYKDQERLVIISEGNDHLKSWGAVSYPNLIDWKGQCQSLEDMSGLAPDAVNLTGGGEPERLRIVRVSADLMPLLGTAPQIGRSFLPEDSVPGSHTGVMLSHRLWQRKFGARRDLVGQPIILDGQPCTIAGVLAADLKLGFFLGFEPELWLPLAPTGHQNRGSRSLLAVARLKSGIPIERAQADLSLIARRLEQQYPDMNAGWRVRLDPLRGSVDPVAYVLLVILVSSILGIVCTNVSNLLLARGSIREKEIAIRAALGAGKLRIMRQLLTESFLLAFLGCCLGVFMAYWACELVRVNSVGTNMEIVDIRLDARVLSATIFLFLLTGLMVGLAPALQSSNIHLSYSLKHGGTGWSSRSSRNRLKQLFIGTEVALSLVLLVGAGLVLKSWTHLWQVDLGYRPERILVAELSLLKAQYPENSERIAFCRQILRRLEGRSEIQSAAISTSLPAMAPSCTFSISGRSKPAPGGELQARFTRISAGYFSTMSIHVKAGRAFNEGDTLNTPPVAIINETLARKHWNQDSPLDSQLEIGGQLHAVVGVIGSLRGIPLYMTPMPEIYLPLDQAPSDRMLLVIRSTHSDPSRLATALKDEIRAADPNQPADRIRSLDKIRSSDMGVIKLGTTLLCILAVVTLVLAAVGIYGVISFSVSQRASEFGVRMALGAQARDILSLVLRQGLRMALAGAIPGVALAAVLGRLLSKSLRGVSPLEPLVLGAIASLLVVVAITACYVPARRATRIDPLKAIRCE